MTRLADIHVLALTQPWASLVAWGEKKWETRSWRTDKRCWVAIHASKGLGEGGQGSFYDRCCQPHFKDALLRNVPPEWRSSGRTLKDFCDSMPRGEIIAVALLSNIIRAEIAVRKISEVEAGFGNYSPGRWAWEFPCVLKLPRPIPFRAGLMLRAAPPDLAKEIRRQVAEMRNDHKLATGGAARGNPASPEKEGSAP